MKKKRTYQAPLVLTVAALTATACGTNDDPQKIGGGSTGGAGTGGTGAGGTGAGGTGGSPGGTGGSTGGSGGSVVELPACDGSELYAECQVGARCQDVTNCTSATQETFVFECTDSGTYTRWTIANTDLSCDKPYAECNGQFGRYSCADPMWLYSGAGGNPPAPCPQTLPEEGSDCYAGAGFGADPPACGYPCADGSGWTVTGCVSNADLTASWQSDGACEIGGAAGESGTP
jgi:hypothetical protein